MTSSPYVPTLAAKELDTDQSGAVKRFLRDYNQAANPLWWSAMDQSENDPRPLDVVIHDRDGEVIGGLLATTAMRWVRLNIMSVHEDHRGRGLGTAMLVCAETEAVRRGCRYAYVDTMDYQAPEFYRRNGYK
ncbi:MAG: GNAT family N-acetyltransferase, partial [Pirellulaceae bacterium]|nr:GNAT family N-acetyltransferase [Pirellulaceae bacterium]